MRKQLTVVVLLMLLFAGMGSSALLTRALAQPKGLTAIQKARQLGPNPTPRWYWRWAAWRLGEGYAKGHQLQPDLRPMHAPHQIPAWAWQRLHFFLLARQERLLAVSKKGQHGHTTTTGTTTTGTTTTGTTPTTTTSTTTTATTTTTTTTTTPSSGSSTYDQAIAYTQSRPAFTPSRTVEVSSASQLLSAIANLQAGDLVEATADFTVSGETVIKNRLSAPAVIDLTGHSVRFVYSGGGAYPAVWLDNAQNVRIYGGDLSTADTGGNCLTSYGGQNVTWWYFSAHDCGGTGAHIAPVNGVVQHDDFNGTIWSVGHVLSRDSHTEKGSGIHCVNLDDSGEYAFQDNRFAFYCHDIPTGAAIEYGSVGVPPVSNTIYLKAVNLTFVSQIQTGGNAIQFWGVNGQSADIKYLEVSNAQGYGLYDGGMYSGTTLSGVTVEYARASRTNLNPRYSGKTAWDSTHGVIYRDVQRSS